MSSTKLLRTQFTISVLLASAIAASGGCSQSSVEKRLEDLEARNKQLEAEIKTLKQSRAVPAKSVIPGELISLGGAPTKGSPQATVVMVEYADFECPACRSFFSRTLAQIDKEYVAPGKLLLAFRHLPLNIHPHALRAGEAAACAARQTKFWEMHDALFADSAPLTDEGLIARAKRLGMDLTAFNACLKGVGTISVRQDASQARELGISSTPTFLLGQNQADGNIKVMQRLSGAAPFASFKRAIDSVLTSR